VKEPAQEPKVLWNPRKAWANLRKHKISFEEAATVFLMTGYPLQSRIRITPLPNAGFSLLGYHSIIGLFL
jgi:hypothetical protein